MAGDRQGGCEVICEAEDCKHNDSPVCTVWTMDEPVRIALGGLCIKYELREV